MDRMLRSRSIKLLCFAIFSIVLLSLLYPSGATKIIYGGAQQQPISFPVIHKRLAIIGAGSAGASTAYYAREYAAQQSMNVNITIFERNNYVGGRSTTVYAYDDKSEPVELGASIFVRVNYNLYDAAVKFGLQIETDDVRSDDGSDELGIWNGEEFVFTQATGSYWELAKMFWKYGLAPLRVKRLVDATIGKFLKMYKEPVFPWESLTQTARDLELTGSTSGDGKKFLEVNSIAPKFANEIVQAATRVNYAANLGYIHGLETMVCMASNTMAIRGGNWQIFQAMIDASHASLRLSTPVTQLTRNDDHTWIVVSSHEDEDGKMTEQTEVYDAVVIAGPYQYTNITSQSVKAPTEIEYVQLHVTLFASPYRLSPKYFGYIVKANVPDIILTTLPPTADPSTNDVGPTGFYSVSLLRVSLRAIEATGKIREEFIYKIFSKVEWSDEQLYKMMGITDDEEKKDALSWKYRKVWNSYPVEYPRAVFQEQRLDFGLWYTAGMESFISTMETNSLSGKNVAANLINDWAEKSKKNKTPAKENL